METVYVDGRAGEGGGQILRTSLTLACITGKSLHIENVRAARRNPGLARQHLSCVRAAAEICGAQCQGASLSSQVLEFQPRHIRGGDFTFDIGSAGSASLVVQTVLPALFVAGESSTVTVTGGTHNPWAPPFDFLAETFLPAVASAGFAADCRLIRHGFFPAGGGKVALDVQPWRRSPGRTLNLCVSGGERLIHARIYTARLPGHIARRQEKLLLQSRLKFENIEHIEVTDSDGPGNCVMLRLSDSLRTTVLTAFGQRGKPSEKVVGEVVRLAESFLRSEAAVDRFLADQLLIYMALLESGCYTTNELSAHLTTNIETIKKFLPIDFTIEQQGQLYRISAVRCA
ncbi:MAG: RNA 3'-terminal phosphate cyclase [Phycisphaerales bacterium]|nr:MAG: RNA 3'-terminal phosphate cyclase [Phycisphaerales bacterium]